VVKTWGFVFKKLIHLQKPFLFTSAEAIGVESCLKKHVSPKKTFIVVVFAKKPFTSKPLLGFAYTKMAVYGGKQHVLALLIFCSYSSSVISLLSALTARFLWPINRPYKKGKIANLFCFSES